MTETHWFACHTRARHEKRVAFVLDRVGIENFLPLVPRAALWTDRTKLTDWPLFPGYVFARFTRTDIHRVLTVPGIACLVRVAGEPAVVPDHDIANVRRFAAAVRRALMPQASKPLLPVPFIAIGERVQVTTGPFAGVSGYVVDYRNRRRVLVGIEGVGGFEVDVPIEQLEVAKTVA